MDSLVNIPGETIEEKPAGGGFSLLFKGIK